jgi:hypothetical protein
MIQHWLQARWFRVIQHLGFWCLSFLILLRIFSDGEVHEVDVLYTFLFHLFLLPPVYLNLLNFVSKLKGKYAWLLYAVKLIVVIALFSWLAHRFFQDWSAHLFPNYYFIAYYSWLEFSIFIFIYLAISTLIKGTRSWFVLSRVQAQLQETEKEKAQMELKALKSQVNPHFLFNTLNGIYSMTLTNDERLSRTVIQLSDLMRYFLYEATEDDVPLVKELALLENYIALQKIRLGEKCKTNYQVNGAIRDQQIAPLLLITFVENAFKHGDRVDGGEFINLQIGVEGEQLSFRISNKKGSIDDIDQERYGGIGLENVRRRLELLYPGKYKLDINDNSDTYDVDLKLQLHAS